jgi:hypothetical protein
MQHLATIQFKDEYHFSDAILQHPERSEGSLLSFAVVFRRCLSPLSFAVAFSGAPPLRFYKGWGFLLTRRFFFAVILSAAKNLS